MPSIRGPSAARAGRRSRRPRASRSPSPDVVERSGRPPGARGQAVNADAGEEARVPPRLAEDVAHRRRPAFTLTSGAGAASHAERGGEERARQREVHVAHLEDDARLEHDVAEDVEASRRERVDVGGRPVSVTTNPPAPTANGNSRSGRRLRRGGRAAEEREGRRAAEAGVIRRVIAGEDTSGRARRKRCMLRIRRPASPRLESPAVPRDETATPRTERPAFFAPLLALLVPSRCGVCDTPRIDLGGGGVCRACWAALPVLDAAAACPHCALPGDGSPCAGCRLDAAGGDAHRRLRALRGRPAHAPSRVQVRRLGPPRARRSASASPPSRGRPGSPTGADALVTVPSTRAAQPRTRVRPGHASRRRDGRRLDTPRRALLAARATPPPQSSLPAPGGARTWTGAFAASPRRAGASSSSSTTSSRRAPRFSRPRAPCATRAPRSAGLVLARTPEPDP